MRRAACRHAVDDPRVEIELRLPGAGAHLQVPDDRERDHLAQRVAFGEDHHEPVDAHAAARRRRVAVLDRARVFLVVRVRHVGVVDHAPLALVDEALPLVDGVVQLGVAADELDAADHRVEVFGQLRVLGVRAA